MRVSYDQCTEEEKKIANRVACSEAGYPQSEAFYDSVEHWESLHKKKWKDWVPCLDCPCFGNKDLMFEIGEYGYVCSECVRSYEH